MLERLSVRGLGIISAVELELDAGFTVLTGETGAGKSLLVESLKLLGGQRAQSDMVRTGDVRLQVEGFFTVEHGSPLGAILDDLGVPRADRVVLRREVTEGGRGRAWLNDVSVTAGALQRIAPYLLAIHGQHEQHGLADSDVQRRLVDDFGSHEELCEETAQRFATWREAADELDRLRKQQATRRDRLDTISFQLQEIDRVDPAEGEEKELGRRRLVLRHAARLADLSSSLLDRLSEGESSVVDGLARAEREIAAIAECGVSLEGGLERLQEARIHVEEVVREVQALGDDANAEPGELESTESRLHALEQLMLKYGSTLTDVLAHRDNLTRERAELESVEERLDHAAAAADRALAEFDRSAAALDSARLAAGAELAAAVEKVLARLAMDGTRLEFQWQPRIESSSPLLRSGQPVAFDPGGVEECVLLIAANPGEEPRPMARIASGGELSRVHLAIRTVLRRRRSAGGLSLLFERRHFRVEKVVDDGRATTRIALLDGGEREAEVARMLAGDELTESARTHARVLLEGP
jgi:DNA repair protein RecN (Recombination protein N)